jgi:hypothetical protein
VDFEDLYRATYEVLPGSSARKLLTLRGAHPTARVVRHAPRP